MHRFINPELAKLAVALATLSEGSPIEWWTREAGSDPDGVEGPTITTLHRLVRLATRPDAGKPDVVRRVTALARHQPGIGARPGVQVLETDWPLQHLFAITQGWPNDARADGPATGAGETPRWMAMLRGLDRAAEAPFGPGMVRLGVYSYKPGHSGPRYVLGTTGFRMLTLDAVLEDTQASPIAAPAERISSGETAA